MMNTYFDVSFEEDVATDDVAVATQALVVYNDHFNSFDWVIKALIEICKHTGEQAEQCAYIIHHRGKYAVKHGSLLNLKTMKDAITERGIHATIE